PSSMGSQVDHLPSGGKLTLKGGSPLALHPFIIIPNKLFNFLKQSMKRFYFLFLALCFLHLHFYLVLQT
ncbi:hypothetical protein OLS59_02090, partial [Campylobacter jejuni]|nr:hypothetical protein [Campylobacter jejuni]